MNDGSAPLASIIVVNYHSFPALGDCLRSLQTHNQTIPTEIIVVDNASRDDSLEQLQAQFPWCRLISLPQNRGFGAGNNAGVAIARGDYLCFLNPDTYLTEDFLPILLNKLEQNPQVGMVAPRLIHPNGQLQLSTAWEISLWGEYRTRQRLQQFSQGRYQADIAATYTQEHTVDIVLGAAFVMRRNLFEEVGGFDEQFFMYFEESDLCQRVRDRGYQILYTPATQVVHLKGTSVERVPDKMALAYRRSQLYYYQKHRPLWEQSLLRGYLAVKFGLRALRGGDRLARQQLQQLLRSPKP